jgi:hypothetical protein
LPDGILHPIWAFFGGAWNEKFWYILYLFGMFVSSLYIVWPIGIFCSHLVHFSTFWYVLAKKSGNPGMYVVLGWPYQANK